MLMAEYDGDKTYEDGKQFADDDKLLVRFEVKPVHNEFMSRKEGRPIFNDTEYISIITPGSRDVFTTPLDDQYRARFAKRYERWKASTNVNLIEGTILAEVPWLTKSQVAELNYSNIQTIEQLANLSDTDAMRMNLMGQHDLRGRAKRYVEAAKGEAPMLKMEEELRKRDSTIQTMQQQLDEMKATVEKLSAKK